MPCKQWTAACACMGPPGGSARLGLAAPQVAVDDPATYKYCLKSQTMPLLGAACDWYRRSYGVDLDPAT